MGATASEFFDRNFIKKSLSAILNKLSIIDTKMSTVSKTPEGHCIFSTLKDRESFERDFWEAPLNTVFEKVTVAAILNRSKSWFHHRECIGKYIPHFIFKSRSFYKKLDVLSFLKVHQDKFSEQDKKTWRM